MAVRLAYIVSAYKLPRNLVRLVERLAEDGELVVVHVDRRTSEATYSEMRAPFEGRPNVHFLPRHRSPYASWGHVRTTLKGLELLRRVGEPYDLVALLTGQDYPIKPLAVVRDRLEPYRSRTLIEHFPLPTEGWDRGGMPRLERWYVPTPHGLHGVPRRWLRPFVMQRLPDGLAPHGGSGYWTMCREHAEYVLDYVARTPSLVRFFKHVAVPDEIFFQTILMNSPHSRALVNDDFRYIDWLPEGAPRLLGESELRTLLERPEPFARKFDVTHDEGVLDALDAAAR